MVFLRSLLKPILFQLTFWKSAAFDRTNPSVRAAGWMILASSLFAVMNISARVASRDADFSQVAAARALGGAIVAFAFGRYRGSVLRVRHRKAMFWRAAFGSIAMLATFHVLSEPAVPLGDAATLFNLAPLGVALLSPPILGERPGKALWLGLALSLLGVVLIFRPSFLFGHGHAQASPVALFAVLAAFFSACAMIAIRKLGKSEAPEAIALHFALFAAAIFSVVAILRWRAIGGLGFGMVAVSALSGGIAQIAMTEAYRLERAARVSSLGYLNVVATSLLGVLFLHEHPDHLAIVGMGLVLAAGIFLATGAVRSAAKVPEAELCLEDASQPRTTSDSVASKRV